MKTNQKIISLTFLLAFFLFSLGCESSQQTAKINGRSIANDAVGFNGYSALLPDGYIPIYGKHGWAEEHKERLQELVNFDAESRSKKIPGLFVVDVVSFYNPKTKSSISFRCEEVVRSKRAFSQWNQNDLEAYMQRILRSHSEEMKFENTANITNFGDHDGILVEGIYSEEYDERVAAKAIVIGKYQEVLTLIGVSTGLDQSSIASDVRETAESISL